MPPLPARAGGAQVWLVRLGQAGLTRKFVVQTALRHGWDDEIANNPARWKLQSSLPDRQFALTYRKTILARKDKLE